MLRLMCAEEERMQVDDRRGEEDARIILWFCYREGGGREEAVGGVRE